MNEMGQCETTDVVVIGILRTILPRNPEGADVTSKAMDR
jgi:hypothetical protein